MHSMAELEPISGDFTGKSIISIDQFMANDVEVVMTETKAMAEMVDSRGCYDLLKGKVVANLFYEASTRTFLSFEAAAKRLGAATISTQGVEFSSISKGESLQDTIRTVDQYADTVALRHSEKGAAAKAASVSNVPIINGGDGIGEHPTQALLDLYTINSKFNGMEDLTITMVGDLKHGRTVHSLARLLGKYKTQINYVSPEQLSMPRNIVEELRDKVVQFETTDLGEVLNDTDVLYVTRIQKERFDYPEEYELHKEAYVVDAEIMEKLDPNSIVLHPLPRVGEIHPEIDKDPRAAYFQQVKNGMYVRMGLLALVNGKSIRY